MAEDPKNPHQLQPRKSVVDFGELVKFLSTRTIFSKLTNKQGTPVNPATKEGQDELVKVMEQHVKKADETSQKVDMFMRGIEMIKGDKGEKGDKGDTGYSPIKGKDYFTKDELNEFAEKVFVKIRIPQDGKTPVAGKDYPTAAQIRTMMENEVALIPVPKDGRMPEHQWNEAKTKVRFMTENGWGPWSSDLKGESGKDGKVVENKTDSSFGLSRRFFGGVSVFTALGDAPSSYAGMGGKTVSVKATEDGLEFSDAGAGDMTKAVYDPTNINGSAFNTDNHIDGTTNKVFSAVNKTKLGHISVTQAVDLDDIETRVALLDTAVILKGGWDASAGTFPGAAVAQAGWSYIVTVAGTVDGVAFSVNDRLLAIIDNASTTVYASNWLKLDYSDLVTSVAGRTGAVTLTISDLTDAGNLAEYAAVNPTAAGLALLDDTTAADQLITLGITATATELNYVDGVTSSIQTQLDSKLDGNGTATYVPYYSDANTLTSEAHFSYNSTTHALHVHKVGGDATDGLILTSENGTEIGVLGAVNTANVVWAGVHNFTAATQDTIAAFTGAGKTLSSLALATYPSLTEISYVKGVTSSIQTQINAKAPTASPTFTGTVTLPVGLTGMLRADAGVVSIDSTSYQPLDSDLTTIAGLTATTDNIIQSVGSAWASRTPTQVTATLIAFVGDSGAGGAKGLVPAPAAGDAAANKFLKSNGTWTTVSASGSDFLVNQVFS